MYINQIIMQYTLNLYSALWQLYLNKIEINFLNKIKKWWATIYILYSTLSIIKKYKVHMSIAGKNIMKVKIMPQSIDTKFSAAPAREVTDATR